MTRQLTKAFLNALLQEFPWLGPWTPRLNTTEIPVTFKVVGGLDVRAKWYLEYGRLNNQPDERYTDGVTTLGISDGVSVRWIDMKEGEFSPEEFLQEGDKYILVRYRYRSELVEDVRGNVEWRLYKRVDEVLQELQQKAARDASLCKAMLERTPRVLADLQMSRINSRTLLTNMRVGVRNHWVYDEFLQISMEGIRTAADEVQILNILCRTQEVLREMFKVHEVAIPEFREFYLSEFDRVCGEIAARITQD